MNLVPACGFGSTWPNPVVFKTWHLATPSKFAGLTTIPGAHESWTDLSQIHQTWYILVPPTQQAKKEIYSALCDITDYNSTWYIVTVLAAVTISCVMLSMQRSRKPFWSSSKSMNSWTATSARMPMRIWLIRAMNLSSHLMAKESEIENGHS